LTIDPTNVDILSIQGRAFNRLQNYSEAIKYFDKALAIDPNGTDIIEELKMQREHFKAISFNQSKNQQLKK
jgi:tetratricopeptide (TPR) repeat protein